ncbi:MAG: ABC transporter substrate-binding protein [Treponema sp.]|nr:ABC transporter substrate-binding protein [Treponema sp.]
MKKILIPVLILCLAGSLFAGPQNQGGGAASGTQMIAGANVPRNQTIILENPDGRITPADNFNRWAPGFRGAATGFQQLALDTLWYIDPDAGLNGVWENALASEKPVYNRDFTQMTVKLRRGIFWSDGVEFTADDLVYTVETHMKTPGLNYNGQFNESVASIAKSDNYTVVFNLKSPNSRFHAYFTVRWDACYIMPKHIFEKQSDVLAFTFNPPVSLGPYTLKSFDPQGNWFLWEKRSDWQRTTLALMGSLAQSPQYAMYIHAGTSDVKVMSQQNHQIDVIHDIAPEGVIALARSNPTTKTWFPGFPWGHPDPTLPAIVFNHEKRGLDDRNVRWALTLSIDITRLAIASYRGAMTVSALAIPPTGMYPSIYFEPLESWLQNYTLDLGDGTSIKPYNPNAALEIATEARKSLGDMVPTNTADIKKYIGAGWWKRDLAAAEKLMKRAGLRRNARNMWEFNDGTPFRINLLANTDLEPSMNRAAAMVVECWREFGVDATMEVSTDRWTLARQGNFEASFMWDIETWGGHPDLFYFLGTFHSSLYRPSGQLAAGRNYSRWRNPKLDTIVDSIRQLDFDDPKVIELGKDYVRLAVDDMNEIPICSYNVFTCMDEYYWTGYPTINDPYTDPVPNWGNSRYMYVRFRSTGK